ncbi:MAG: hypothetical protein ACRENL_03065 [Candidatus Dormibacteria bacterium]
MIFAAEGAQIAHATQSLPRTVGAWSWYITHGNDSTGVAYQLGCNEGHARAGDLGNSEIILDFGSQVPNQSETRLPFHDGFASYSLVESMSEQFARGYFECTGSDTTTVLKLAVGTTNDNVDGEYNSTTTAYNGGYAWSQVALIVRNWVASSHYTAQVDVGAASDMETEFGGQSATLAFTNGYSSNSGAPFYLDFGDAGGCPINSYTGGNGYGCNSGWNQYGVWYKSWGPAPAFPLPEIYNQPLANQWWTISRYGYYERNAALHFEGPLDDYDRDHSTFTPTQAWNALSNEIGSDSHTNYSMTYSCEIH